MESERLVLRHYTRDDAASYLAMWAENAEHLREFIPDEIAAIDSAAGMEARIAWLVAQKEARRLFVFGAWSKDGRYLGEAYLANPALGFLEFEIGWFLVSAATGQGFAAEAVRRVVDFAFGALNVEWLRAEIAADNTGSSRVASRCGFHLAQRRAGGHRRKDGSLVDLLIYARSAPIADSRGPTARYR